MTDAPRFGDYLVVLAGELGIRLDPWQERTLERLASGAGVLVDLAWTPRNMRRAHRRWTTAAAIAAGAAGGRSLNLVAPEGTTRDALIAEAVQLLDGYSRAYGVDLGLATEAARAAMR
jgi:hypothetical protein